MGLNRIKERLLKTFNSDNYPDELGENYLELDTEKGANKKAKIIVRPFVIEDFADVKPVLDSLREGYTIALINIKPLRTRDIIELKRTVNKMKKTCDAMNGDIAGFGEDWIVVTPPFAAIYRSMQTEDVSGEQ